LKLFGESIVVGAGIDARHCVDAIAAILKQHAATFDYIHVYGLNYADPFWEAATCEAAFSRRAGLAPFAMRREKIHLARIRSSFDEYLASRSASSRQTLRYSNRRFFTENGARLEIFTAESDIPRLLEAVEQVYARSWQAKTFAGAATTHRDQQSFFNAAAREGWLRSYLLFRDEQPVAYQLGVLYRRVYYLMDCAFRQDFAAWSPGSVITFRALEDLHDARKADVWDFGFGDMPYKRRFGDSEDDAAIVYFVPPNRWRCILRLQQLANSSYDFLRSILVRMRVDRIVRKMIKRQR
jgi:hypothetical protein